MRLSDFRDLLLKADLRITRNRGAGAGNYTVWTPGGINRNLYDDLDGELVQRVYVERFTKIDDDPVYKKIWKVLEEEYIPFEYEHDHEYETGYNHHTFTCYVQISEL